MRAPSWCLLALLAAAAGAPEPQVPGRVDAPGEALPDTDLILAFVMFRHGDRTPDQEELDTNPGSAIKALSFFPYGLKALTNTGKMRGYIVGKFLRDRYDGFLSRLYLQEEITVRCTDYDRTKMTALTALAALYPPERLQQWNPALDWQPVPYSVLPRDYDDLLYWYNCPYYMRLRDKIYEMPEIKEEIDSYTEVFKELSYHTKNNITNTEEVFFLDNLFQATENVGIPAPDWSLKLMPAIKNLTKLEYKAEFYTEEIKRFSSGILMESILNATEAAVNGLSVLPRMRVYSAHENNVAALMAAAGVFYPHQPKYGATFALELHRIRDSGQYGIAAVYSPTAGGPGSALPVRGCGGGALCDYDTFLKLTAGVVLSRAEYEAQCHA